MTITFITHTHTHTHTHTVEFIHPIQGSDDHQTTYYNKEEAIAYHQPLLSDEERKLWLEHTYERNGKTTIEYDDMVNH